MSPADEEWDLDDIVDHIAATSMTEGPAAAVQLARQMLADTAAPDLRSALLEQVGDYCSLAGDLTGAERAYRDALDTGDGTELDLRASLADVLWQQGRGEEAQALAEEIRRDPSTPPSVHVLMGEAWEAHGDLDRAHAWFTRGIQRGEETGEEWDRTLLLQSRGRVRQAMGLPRDELDNLAGEAPWSTEEQPAVDSLGILHWPAGELSALSARWPDLAEGYGSDWDEHRRRTEQTLREYGATAATRLQVAAGSLAGLERHARDSGRDPALSSTRAAYAAEIVRRGEGTAWPPGRNEPCWCGSGAKYKRCCGRPG